MVHDRSDDEILTKREEASVSLRNLQGDLLNPIKKKLKLEGGLQEGYEHKIKIFLAGDENNNVTQVKQEQAGPNVNVKLKDSHS